eukprot:scaffold66373_cov40-Phaeocystis_antarctica.AAC.2
MHTPCQLPMHPPRTCHAPAMHPDPRISTCRRRSTRRAPARSSSSASPPPSAPPSFRSPAWRASWRRSTTPSFARRSGCRCSWPPAPARPSRRGGAPPLAPRTG